MLEAMSHGDNAFVTLTYEDDNVRSLVPKDPQDWLKRIRKAVEPIRLRYYLVGEYGDLSERPHYHVALFGYPSCTNANNNFRTRFDRSGKVHCCSHCELLSRTWGLGRIDNGSLTTESAQYIAGYVTKKMTAKDDPRLDGRHPEFGRMSLRPGIGVNSLHEVASTLMEFNLDKTQDDVPSSLRHGNKVFPLGRYLRRKLRVMLGKPENTPHEISQAIQKELRALYEDSSFFEEGKSYKEHLLSKGKQKAASLIGRTNIYKGNKKL